MRENWLHSPTCCQKEVADMQSNIRISQTLPYMWKGEYANYFFPSRERIFCKVFMIGIPSISYCENFYSSNSISYFIEQFLGESRVFGCATISVLLEALWYHGLKTDRRRVVPVVPGYRSAQSRWQELEQKWLNSNRSKWPSSQSDYLVKCCLVHVYKFDC